MGLFIKEGAGELQPVAKAAPKPIQKPAPVHKCDICKGPCHPALHIPRAHAKRVAELEKAKLDVLSTINDAPHKPLHGRDDDHRSAEDRALTAVSELADLIRNESAPGPKRFAYEQSIVEALQRVDRQTRDLYIAARARQDAERRDPNGNYAGDQPGTARRILPGTGDRTARPLGKVDLEGALQAHRNQVTKSDRVPITKASKQIRSARTTKGLTQQQLADLAGCSRPTISSLENDTRTTSGLALAAICRALGLSPFELGR